MKTLQRLQAGHHVTIVALGDSNTELTFHTRGHHNWVGLLSEGIFEKYGNGICQMINSGKCASTFREALTRLDRDVLRFEPDMVIVALGMNDSGGGPDNLHSFRDDVRRLISRLGQSGSEMIICTPNPIVTSNGIPLPLEQPQAGMIWDPPQRQLAKYAEALADMAAEHGCFLVDHYKLWCQYAFPEYLPVANPNGLWMRMSDHIHPGPLGHLAFYRALAPLFDLAQRFPWEE